LRGKEHDKFALESGHLYGVALWKQAKFAAPAEQALKEIFKARRVVSLDQIETFESL
jgi:hypothetical protein